MHAARTPSGFIRGIDNWAPPVVAAGVLTGGATRVVPIMTWSSLCPVPWSLVLRQRQVDYSTADGQGFPDNFDAIAYEGGTLRAVVEFDDDESSHGEATIRADFGSQTHLVVPPTKRLNVGVAVAAGFVGEAGSIAGGATQQLRAFEAVAYARPLADNYGPPPRRVVTLTDWVVVNALQTYIARVPRGATHLSFGSRTTAGAASYGITANVDVNDALAVPAGGGPIWQEQEGASFQVPRACSRVRFSNPGGFDLRLAAVWSIEA